MTQAAKAFSRTAGIGRILFLILVTGLTVAGISSCRSTKKITKAINKNDSASRRIVTTDSPRTVEDMHADSVKFMKSLYDHLQATRVNCNTFSAKMKVHYEGSDGKNYEFNAFLRLEKDKAIWVSINAVLGIEAFRLLITPDSVKVLNKLDKVYQLRSVGYLKEISHLPFDFHTVQDLLLGNAIYVDSNLVYYHKDDKGISLLSVGNLFRNYITLNKNDLTIMHDKLDDVDRMRSRSCDLIYGDYEKRDTLLFSTYRKIAVAEKTRLDIELTYKQYSFNEPLSMPFTIPKNYKRK